MEKMKMDISPTKAVTLSLLLVSTTVALAVIGLKTLNGLDATTPGPITSLPNVPPTTIQVREAYGQLPLNFEANRSQAKEGIDLRARGAGYTLTLSPTEAVFLLAGEAPSPRRNADGPSAPDAERPQTVLRLNIVGANPNAPVAGLDELEGKIFRPLIRSKTRSPISTFL